MGKLILSEDVERKTKSHIWWSIDLKKDKGWFIVEYWSEGVESQLEVRYWFIYFLLKKMIKYGIEYSCEGLQIEKIVYIFYTCVLRMKLLSRFWTFLSSWLGRAEVVMSMGPSILFGKIAWHHILIHLFSFPGTYIIVCQYLRFFF